LPPDQVWRGSAYEKTDAQNLVINGRNRPKEDAWLRKFNQVKPHRSLAMLPDLINIKEFGRL